MSGTEQPQRITPLLPAQWDDEVLDALGAFPSGLAFVLKQWREDTGDRRGWNTLGFLAHYPALAKAYLTLNKHVAADTSLPFREKELVILRATWLKSAKNEFYQHIILGRRVGLTDEEMLATSEDLSDHDWPEHDANLLAAVDDLHRDNRISDATFVRLQQDFSQQQIMDLIFLVGCYALIGSAVSSFNIPVDAGTENFDPLIARFL